MADQAGKLGPVIGVGMARSTVGPGAVVVAGIYREKQGIVLNKCSGFAGRVTGETSAALIHICGNAAVVRIGFSLGMAGGATEYRAIAGVRVTLGTGIPDALMNSGVNREIQGIVLRKLTGRTGGVA